MKVRNCPYGANMGASDRGFSDKDNFTDMTHLLKGAIMETTGERVGKGI